MPAIGIPYVRHQWRGNQCFVTCPACKLEIALTVRKDFESLSGSEYARHYESAHHEVAEMAGCESELEAFMSPKRDEMIEKLRLASHTGTSVTLSGSEATEALRWWGFALDAANLSRTRGPMRKPPSSLD